MARTDRAMTSGGAWLETPFDKLRVRPLQEKLDDRGKPGHGDRVDAGMTPFGRLRVRLLQEKLDDRGKPAFRLRSRRSSLEIAHRAISLASPTTPHPFGRLRVRSRRQC
jgi:hypothetical protein